MLLPTAATTTTATESPLRRRLRRRRRRRVGAAVPIRLFLAFAAAAVAASSYPIAVAFAPSSLVGGGGRRRDSAGLRRRRYGRATTSSAAGDADSRSSSEEEGKAVAFAAIPAVATTTTTTTTTVAADGATFASSSRNESTTRSTPLPTPAAAAAAAEVDDDDGGGGVVVLGRLSNATVKFPCYDRLMRLRPGQFVESDPLEVPLLSSVGDDKGERRRRRSYETFRVKLYPRGGGHSSSSSSSGGGTAGNQTSSSFFGMKRQKSGFGMSYRVLPSFTTLRDDESRQKLGAYLRYVPPSEGDEPSEADDDQEAEFVDASFSLTLKGRQRYASDDDDDEEEDNKETTKFDVQWRSGMRFVPSSESKLSDGRANDFGAHLMRTQLLEQFLGVVPMDVNTASRSDSDSFIGSSRYYDDDAANAPVEMQVSITVHGRPPVEQAAAPPSAPKTDHMSRNSSGSGGGGFWIPRFQDLRGPPETRATRHDAERVRAGKIVVPVLEKLSQRPNMFRLGVYPGVEYRLMRVADPDTDRDLFYSRPGADYELKPIYPLVQQLERPWPVRVNERDIPKLFDSTMYNVASAGASLVTAFAALTAAFVVSQAVSLFVIPTRSMDPTLQVGDVLLVDKVTPRLFSGDNHRVGDVVLFHPPQALQDIVSQSRGGGKGGISDRDLFVKRVVAEPGDRFAVGDRVGTVRVNGVAPEGDRNLCTAEPLRLIERYIRPTKDDDDAVVPSGGVAVLGDCSSVSIDSRVWGPLPVENIVGKPVMRVWPLSRFGSIPPLPTADADWTE